MKTAIKLIPVLLILTLTIFFNIGLIDIRFEEIRYLLGSIASQDDISNTFGIVAKYELIKRRMQFGEENVTNYELEAKIQTIIATGIEKNDSGKQSFSRIPVRVVLNGIRLLLGKKMIDLKEDDKIFGILELAYFLERNRKYTEALKIYEDIIATANLQPSIRAAIFVHQAFCYSMVSNYSKAKQIYEEVISNFPNTEAGILAWRLLDFIQSMENERNVVDKSKISGLEKARQFYILMDFRNAIKYYSTNINDSMNNVNSSEAHFYKGRSHEELGETEDALAEYRLVIKLDKQNKWARQANRRMLMLGEFYEQQKGISEEAKRQLEIYHDQQFIKNMESYSSMLPVNSLKNELFVNNSGKKDAIKVNDSILNLIDKIGTIDLIGESDVNKKKEIELKKELIENGIISTAEIKELERKNNLNQNPYRRPSFLKEIIDKNSQELRYIYNKKLRTGEKLSGKVIVEFVIKPDGNISKAKVAQSNIGDQNFEADITTRILQWHFNEIPDSLGDLTINYPFEFYQE